MLIIYTRGWIKQMLDSHYKVSHGSEIPGYKEHLLVIREVKAHSQIISLNDCSSFHI